MGRGKPAARVGDMHVCPKVTSKVPHIGGLILTGAKKVRIGNMMAAHGGSKLFCVVPPGAKPKGSSLSKKVRIENKWALRQFDGTDHNGKIIMGFPTVRIG